MGRKIFYGLAGAALLLPGAAVAAANPHFDVETATRAYLDLLRKDHVPGATMVKPDLELDTQ